MRYANLYWQNTELNESDFRAVNIGDNLQFLAVDYIYSKFLAEDEKIVKLQIAEMKDYKGELLILPLNWALFDINYMEEEKIAISNDIIPVFLAVTIESGNYKKEYFNDYNISYLKRYEPIGCRDAYTMKTLQNYGIRAYLNGCMTATFPERKDASKRKKVFLVDVPIEVEEYIPLNIRQDSQIMTQQYYYEKDVAIDKIVEDIKDQYYVYAKEAKLVITSRLHVAAPCMAMGIPTIFVKNEVDARFSWLDKYIPLYDRMCYDKIDWNPQKVEYEEIKMQIIDNAIQTITDTYERYARAEKVNSFFSNIEDREYISFQKTIYNNIEKAYAFLCRKYDPKDRFVYSIWGCNEAAETFYEYMNDQYPNARLKDVIDSYKREEFHGINTVTPEQFEITDSEIIFVLPVKASNVAKKIFEEKGISKEQYVCCGSVFIGKE